MSDVEEIAQLLLHERRARDRGWWDRMAACYHVDSLVEVSWLKGTGAEFVERSRATAKGGRPPGTHRLSPPVIDVNGDRGVVELPMNMVVRTLIKGVAADVNSTLRVLYRVRRGEDGWKIQAATAIYERDTLTPVVPGTTLAIDEDRLNTFREPYRFLAYILTLEGLSPGDGLYGDDQPEQVAELYRAAFGWLDGKG